MIGLVFGADAVLVSQRARPQKHVFGLLDHGTGVNGDGRDADAGEGEDSERGGAVDEDGEAEEGRECEWVLGDEYLGGEGGAARVGEDAVEGAVGGDDAFELETRLDDGAGVDGVVVGV